MGFKTRRGDIPTTRNPIKQQPQWQWNPLQPHVATPHGIPRHSKTETLSALGIFGPRARSTVPFAGHAVITGASFLPGHPPLIWIVVVFFHGQQYPKLGISLEGNLLEPPFRRNMAGCLFGIHPSGDEEVWEAALDVAKQQVEDKAPAKQAQTTGSQFLGNQKELLFNTL